MDSIQASPKKTWAVVVGIDRYDAGTDWNLDGPVNDARDFVQWLLCRGVPAEQILLFLSPDGEMVQGIPSRRADVDALHKVFERELPGKQGDLLIVFWGGHGAIDGDQRLLFCADTVATQKHNLNLNELLHLLRTESYPSFNHLIVIVDACANYLYWMDEPATLPKRTLSKMRSDASKQQFILYAAADGERAKNDQTEKTGAFSREILAWLSANANETAAQWPPDLELMAQTIKRYFADLSNQGLIHQTPICIRWKSWDGEEENLFGKIEDAQQRTKLMAEVREKLREFDVDTDAWRRIYDQVIEYTGRDFSPPASRDAMIRNLVLVRPESDFPEPVYEFLWRASMQLEGLGDLQKFSEAKINDRGKLRNLSERIKDEQNESEYYLLVELVSSASPKRPFAKSFQWWLWHGGRKLCIDVGHTDMRSGKPDEVQRKFLDLLQRPELQRAGTLHLEFFLETGMMLRPDLDIDRWPYKRSLLGAVHPIAVRWPMQNPHCEEWKKQTRKIRKNADRCKNPVVHWLDPAQDKKVAPAFNKADAGPIFGIASMPGAEFLQLLLECGAPFLFWPRGAQPDQSRFENSLKTTAIAGHLDQFPLRVRELREQALDEEEHPGASLTLLWDDPERVPVTQGFTTNE